MRQRTLLVLVVGVSFVVALLGGLLLRTSDTKAGGAMPVVAGSESASGPVSPNAAPPPIRAPSGPLPSQRNVTPTTALVADEIQHSVQEVSAGIKELADCRSEHRCPAGTECARTADGRLGCYASNCKGLNDFASCARDESCAEVSAGFFRCAPAGFVPEGEECVDRQSANVARRCSGGLRCVAGHCGAPCEPSKGCTTSAMTCLETPSGGVCVPVGSLCDVRHPCPTAQGCLADERAGTTVCIAANPLPSGQSGCVPGSCPDGQDCAGARWGARYYGRCLVDCTAVACPTNSYCAPADLQKLAGPPVCHPTCKPPGTECGVDGQCVFNPTKGIGLCAATMPYDNTTNSLHEWDAVFPPSPDAFPKPR